MSLKMKLFIQMKYINRFELGTLYNIFDFITFFYKMEHEIMYILLIYIL